MEDATPEQVISAGVAATVVSGGPESLNFLNSLIAQLWPYANQAGAKAAKEIVEPMFKEMLPGPLKSLHFETIDLGTTPITFDNIAVHKINKEGIKIDIDVKWDGEMDVRMDIDYMPSFGVRHVKLDARVSVTLHPLIPEIPLVAAANLSMINPPEIELDLTGVANVGDLAGIDRTLRKVINSVIRSMLVLPNRMLIKLDPKCSIFQSYIPPLGFLRIKVVSGEGFKNSGTIIRDTPDIYCQVTFGGNKPCSTQTINNSDAPQWEEDMDFLLSDHDQTIAVDCYDSDVNSDDFLGSALITAGELLVAGGQKTLPLISQENAETGATITLACEAFAMCGNADALKEAAAAEPVKGHYIGLLTILVAGAKRIPGAREDLSVSAKVECGDESFATPAVGDVAGMDPNNPAFDVTFRVLLTPGIVESAPETKFSLLNGRKALGEGSITFDEILSAPDMIFEKEMEMECGGVLLAKAIMTVMTPHLE